MFVDRLSAEQSRICHIQACGRGGHTLRHTHYCHLRSIDNPEEDTVLINKLTLCDSLNLPMSYTRGEDTFYFMLQQYGTGLKTIDTVWVEKENLPHFESVDCNPSMFHTINGVRFTRHAIDSIKVNNNNVTYYDTKAHFLIYFKNRGI